MLLTPHLQHPQRSAKYTQTNWTNITTTQNYHYKLQRSVSSWWATIWMNSYRCMHLRRAIPISQLTPCTADLSCCIIASAFFIFLSIMVGIVAPNKRGCYFMMHTVGWARFQSWWKEKSARSFPCHMWELARSTPESSVCSTIPFEVWYTNLPGTAMHHE